MRERNSQNSIFWGFAPPAFTSKIDACPGFVEMGGRVEKFREVDLETELGFYFSLRPGYPSRRPLQDMENVECVGFDDIIFE